MCRVVSCVVGRRCLLSPVCFLDKTLLACALLHFVLPRSNVPLTPGISWPALRSSRLWWKEHLFFCVSSRRSWRFSSNHSTSASWHWWLGHRLGLLWCWMVCLGNEPRSFCHFWGLSFSSTEFQTLVDYEGYSFSSKAFLPTVVDTVIWGGCANSWEKRCERQRRKGKIHQLKAEFQRTARSDKKDFLSEQCKEIEENNRMGKTRDLFKKIRDTKGTFHAKMGTIKDRSGMDLTEAEDIKKRWQEYTGEPYKKGLNHPDNHDGVVTYLELDLLYCEVSCTLRSITTNKASGADGIPKYLKS